MRRLISSILARFGYTRVLDGWYTIVFDWADPRYSHLPGVSIQVQAHNKQAAISESYREAWHMYAGRLDEIPKDAEYDEFAALEMWLRVAVLDGFALPA